MNPEMTILYVHNADRIGYGRMSNEIVKIVEARGIKVYDDDGRPPEYQTEVSLDNNPRAIPEHPTNVLNIMSVPTHLDGRYDKQFVSILTMWEARTIPPAFRDTLHEYDLVMVPSLQNVELFGQHHDNVQFLSLGVDPALWHPIPVTMPGAHFNFLISGRGPRKGIDLAYEAFRTVFTKPEQFTPVPRLIMKSMKGHQDYYSNTVTHVTGIMESLDERDLYANAHCYLQPSRGEGFGLQPLQAMALGRPTILTADHGHASFAHLGIGLSTTPSKADYFIFGDAGEWWEPNFEELCEAMWDVYSNYAAHVAKAEQSAAYIAENLTWEKSAERFIELHGSELTTPYSGTETWEMFERQLYPMRVIRTWKGEVAGRQMIMEPGITYWEYADIKRILFDAELLAADTPDDAEGLLPAQVAQMDVLRAEQAFCPECHQRLNSGSKRSDEIFEQLEAEARQQDMEEQARLVQ